MIIEEVIPLDLDGLLAIKVKRHTDNRGYFTETYNIKSFLSDEKLPLCLNNVNFQQINEAKSLKNTFRGLHYQSTPEQGKLVRLISGHLIDFALDFRIDSPTYGHIYSYEIKETNEIETFTWLWIPPGFAHGTLLLENSVIEYFCTEIWNPNSDNTISIFSGNIIWNDSIIKYKNLISDLRLKDKLIISAKDLNAQEWND